MSDKTYYQSIVRNVPASVKTPVNDVLNKKFGTSTTYPPEGWPSRVNLLGKLPTRTATGAIAHFTDGADDVPIKSGIFAINPYQEGTGDPSPSNPRAIHGYTGINIHVADGESPHIVDNTYPISWQTEAGTVYGGLLNATTGVLRVTWAKKILKGSENWSDYPGGVGAYLEIFDMKSGNAQSFLSNFLPTVSSQNNFGIRFGASNDFIYVCQIFNTIQGVTDVAEWKTYLETNNLQIVYELATPLEVQLTPQEVRTLLGENNIYHDCNGDSTIEYRADIDLLITELGG